MSLVALKKHIILSFLSCSLFDYSFFTPRLFRPVSIKIMKIVKKYVEKISKWFLFVLEKTKTNILSYFFFDTDLKQYERFVFALLSNYLEFALDDVIHPRTTLQHSFSQKSHRKFLKI